MTVYGLTREQQRCLDFVHAYIGEHGIAPSYREIAAALGLHSKSGTHRLISALVERDHIVRVPNRWRSIALAAGPTYSLPPDLQAALDRHCRERGDTAACVVVDAVAGYLRALFPPGSSAKLAGHADRPFIPGDAA